MKSLSVLSSKNEIKNLVEKTIEFSNKLDLQPIITFYLEDRLLRNLIKKLDNKLGKLFQENKFNREKFIQEAVKILVEDEQKLTSVKDKIINKKYIQYIYYAVPIDNVEVTIVRNNWVPPRAIILRGKVRFTFMPHTTFSELEQKINTQNEDDTIVEFENGVVINYERKRNIFTDFRNTSEVLQSKEQVIVNLAPTLDTYLLAAVIANNVYPWINRVKITRNGENLEYEIISGKASKEEVINGNTIDPQSKAELFYDYKVDKKLDAESIINGIIYKLPGI
ncbi:MULTISPECIES: hypothetical protein [unclassified Stygiolobus]|uniref:hypothetical protein n=1 Tax=unclassified Stygiolobus TaxID=2824672 RepID=UPI00307F90B3